MRAQASTTHGSSHVPIVIVEDRPFGVKTLGDGRPVAVLRRDLQFTANTLTAALYCALTGRMSEELTDQDPAEWLNHRNAREVVAMAAWLVDHGGAPSLFGTLDGIEQYRWHTWSERERDQWRLCAARVWRAFNLPGPVPTQPGDLSCPDCTEQGDLVCCCWPPFGTVA